MEQRVGEGTVDRRQPSQHDGHEGEVGGLLGGGLLYNRQDVLHVLL